MFLHHLITAGIALQLYSLCSVHQEPLGHYRTKIVALLPGLIYPGQGCGGPGAYPGNIKNKVRIFPEWNTSPSQTIVPWRLTFIYSFTPRGNLEESLHLLACFWKVGENWRTRRKPTQTQGKPENSTQTVT